jgi:hypothetical protein
MVMGMKQQHLKLLVHDDERNVEEMDFVCCGERTQIAEECRRLWSFYDSIGGSFTRTHLMIVFFLLQNFS